jgi:hypothetical protein
LGVRAGSAGAESRAGEELAQAAVVDVAPGVVGLQAARVDAVAGEERQRALDEAGDGVGAFVAVLDQREWSSRIEWQYSQPALACFSADER